MYSDCANKLVVKVAPTKHDSLERGEFPIRHVADTAASLSDRRSATTFTISFTKVASPLISSLKPVGGWISIYSEGTFEMNPTATPRASCTFHSRGNRRST